MLGKLPTLSSVGIIQRRCFPSGAIEYSPMTGGAKDASPSHSDLNVAWGYFCYEARLVKSKVRQGNECHSSRFQSERDGVRILEDGPKATKKNGTKTGDAGFAEGLDTERLSPADSRREP